MAGSGATSAHAAGPAKRAAVSRARTIGNSLVANAIASTPVAGARSTAVADISRAGAGASSAVAHVPITCAWTRAAIPHPARRLLPSHVLPGIGLPVLHGVATRGAAEFIGRASVAVRSSATVLRVMLPVAIAPISAIDAVAAVDAVAVVHEVVIVIDGDVVVAAPAAVVTPSTAPHRPHCNSHSK